MIFFLLEHPDLVLDPADVLERPGFRRQHHAPQVVGVVLERFLPVDHVPTAGDRRHHEIGRTGLGQLELYGVQRIRAAGTVA